MNDYALAHLSDDVLLRDLHLLVAQDRSTTALLLAHLAEVETRRLHLRRGYDSMTAYCVGELKFSDGAARRRVYAAHIAKQYPAMFPAIAEGKIHLTAVLTLAPRLTQANAEDLIASAAHRTSAELELELARRFPQPEALRLDDGVSPQVVVRQVGDPVGRTLTCVQPAPDPPKAPTEIAPITVERYTVQVTIDAETHDLLRQVQALLGQSGDVPEVLKRSLKVMLQHLRKRRFSQVEAPGSPRQTSRVRTIPAHVQRVVHARDGERCAFVGDEGHRCGSTMDLEFDHILPVAQGGRSTMDNVRLVCRIHNQFAADQSFGRDFMDRHRRKAVLPSEAATPAGV